MEPDSVTTFDPYYKWLGIPPEAQPPDYYQLLGLQRFEKDADVIASAADRQMGHVKSFASGPHSATSQRILNELAKARLSLLNPTSKKEYDAGLRRTADTDIENGHPTQPASQPSSESGPTFPTAAPAVRFATHRSSLRSYGPGKRRKTPPVISILSLLVFLFMGLAAAYVLMVKFAPQLDFLNIFVSRTMVAKEAPRSKGNDLSERRDSGIEQEDQSVAPAPDEPNKDAAPPQARIVVQNPHQVEPEPGDAESSLEDAHHEAAAQSRLLEKQQRELPDTKVPPIEHAAYGGLPAEIDLPRVDGAPFVLGQIESSEQDRTSLRIIPPDAPSRVQQVVHSRLANTQGEDRCWEVFIVTERERAALESGSDDFDAIARFILRDGELTFQWLSHATTENWEQLRNCVVEIRNVETTRVVQLREAQRGEPIVLTGEKQPYQVKLPYESMPPLSNVFLSISLENFPRLKPVTGDPERLPADEEAAWVNPKVPYVGLAVWWKRNGDQVELNVAPGYRLESMEQKRFILSLSDLAARRMAGVRYIEKLESELKERQGSRPHLQQQLNGAQSMPVSMNGVASEALVQRRNHEVNNAAKAMTQNDEAINNLNNTLIPLARGDLQKFPTLESFARRIENRATVKLCLYSSAGDHKVILYTSEGLKTAP